MARKDVFKGTLESMMGAPAPSPSKSLFKTAALGALDSELARGLKLADLDPKQISPSKFEDRFPYTEADLADLVESIRKHGQQLPILVQRLEEGSYEIIYGRRRAAAARILGIQVKALITDLPETQRIIAQGVENSARVSLSFIEKAVFAARLRKSGIEEDVIRAALNTEQGAAKAPIISTMRTVVDALGEEVIMEIGAAPGIGRPRWRKMATLWRELDPDDALRREILSEIQSVSEFSTETDDEDPPDLSDQRFLHGLSVLRSLARRAISPPSSDAASEQDVPDGAPARDQEEIDADPDPPGLVKATPRSFQLQVKAEDHPEFHTWLVDQGEQLLRDLYAQWQTEAEQTLKKETR